MAKKPIWNAGIVYNKNKEKRGKVLNWFICTVYIAIRIKINIRCISTTTMTTQVYQAMMLCVKTNILIAINYFKTNTYRINLIQYQGRAGFVAYYVILHYRLESHQVLVLQKNSRHFQHAHMFIYLILLQLKKHQSIHLVEIAR